jgi:hypothetical protein
MRFSEEPGFAWVSDLVWGEIQICLLGLSQLKYWKRVHGGFLAEQKADLRYFRP